MPACSTNSVNKSQEVNTVSVVIDAMFKQRRDRLQAERRQTWLEAIAEKRQVK